MVNRVHGGVITDQTLTGSIRYFEIGKTGIGANAIGDGNYRAAYASIGDGGASYAATNVLTVAGGTGTAPTFTVLTVDGAGAVTSVALTTDGDLSAIPANPAATTGGAGTGATLDVVYTSNIIIPNATDATAQTGEFYVDYGKPVIGSAADVALFVVAQRANIVQIAIMDDNTIQFAVENTGYAWETIDGSGTVDDDMLDAINALGSVTVPDETNTGTTIDFSTGVTITEKFFSSGIT